MIRTDVTWRDYRLIDQATKVAAFNPKFSNRQAISRSVDQEINYAVQAYRPVFIYQDGRHDPEAIVPAHFGPTKAEKKPALAPPPGDGMVILTGSVDEIF